MKIAMVIEQFDLRKGGQERSTFEIAELIARRDLDVTIVTAEADGFPEGARCKLADLDIVSPSRAARFERFARATNEFFQGHRFDLIHAITPVPSAHVYQPRGGVVGEIYARNIDRYTGFKRWLRKLNGPNPRQKRVEKVERYLAKKTPCVFLAVSEYVKRQCRQHLAIPDERIRVIFNGVDLRRLPEDYPPDQRDHLRKVLKIGDDQLLGAFIATNFKLKGLDVVIEAARRLRNRKTDDFAKFKFLIAGPDKNRRYFKKVEKLGLADNLLFLGPVGDVASLYHTADFLIHPTWYDPCSRVVLEAMACGLPAISTRYNGASELLDRLDCGLVMDDPNNPDELIDAWLKLSVPERRRRFSRNGQAARSEIGMDRHVDQLVEFYQMFLTQRK
jgi:UDP-glucose:(heptosyl)LPS alpha-1,3-glucosyltransferase